jgi:hypothetical protein
LFQANRSPTGILLVIWIPEEEVEEKEEKGREGYGLLIFSKSIFYIFFKMDTIQY